MKKKNVHDDKTLTAVFWRKVLQCPKPQMRSSMAQFSIIKLLFFFNFRTTCGLTTYNHQNIYDLYEGRNSLSWKSLSSSSSSSLSLSHLEISSFLFRPLSISFVFPSNIDLYRVYKRCSLREEEMKESHTHIAKKREWYHVHKMWSTPHGGCPAMPMSGLITASCWFEFFAQRSYNISSRGDPRSPQRPASQTSAYKFLFPVPPIPINGGTYWFRQRAKKLRVIG